MSLTFSWVRLLVALRPSSWIWFCSSWIIWGKPVDTARSKTYIFAMSEGRKKFIMKFTNNLKNIFNTIGNTWFEMQNYRSICRQAPPLPPPNTHTFLLIPWYSSPGKATLWLFNIFSELFPTHSSTILPSVHLFQSTM